MSHGVAQQLVFPLPSFSQLLEPQTRLLIHVASVLQPPSPSPHGEFSVQQSGLNVGSLMASGVQFLLPLSSHELTCLIVIGLSITKIYYTEIDAKSLEYKTTRISMVASVISMRVHRPRFSFGSFGLSYAEVSGIFGASSGSQTPHDFRHLPWIYLPLQSMGFFLAFLHIS